MIVGIILTQTFLKTSFFSKKWMFVIVKELWFCIYIVSLNLKIVQRRRNFRGHKVPPERCEYSKRERVSWDLKPLLLWRDERSSAIAVLFATDNKLHCQYARSTRSLLNIRRKVYIYVSIHNTHVVLNFLECYTRYFILCLQYMKFKKNFFPFLSKFFSNKKYSIFSIWFSFFLSTSSSPFSSFH